MSGALSGIELFIRGCFIFKLPNNAAATNHYKEQVVSQVRLSNLEFIKPITDFAYQVQSIARNQDIIRNFNLSTVFTRLPLENLANMRMASYENVFPTNWAGDLRKEARHKEIVEKIVNWPKIDSQVYLQSHLLMPPNFVRSVFHRDD